MYTGRGIISVQDNSTTNALAILVLALRANGEFEGFSRFNSPLC